MRVIKTETATIEIPDWGGFKNSSHHIKINRPHDQVVALFDVLKESLEFNRYRFGSLIKKKITEPIEELEGEVKVLKLLGLTHGESVMVLRQLIRELKLLV